LKEEEKEKEKEEKSTAKSKKLFFALLDAERSSLCFFSHSTSALA
jgi:hypothetical protein